MISLARLKLEPRELVLVVPELMELEVSSLLPSAVPPTAELPAPPGLGEGSIPEQLLGRGGVPRGRKGPLKAERPWLSPGLPRPPCRRLHLQLALVVSLPRAQAAPGCLIAQAPELGQRRASLR